MDTLAVRACAGGSTGEGARGRGSICRPIGALPPVLWLGVSAQPEMQAPDLIKKQNSTMTARALPVPTGGSPLALAAAHLPHLCFQADWSHGPLFVDR